MSHNTCLLYARLCGSAKQFSELDDELAGRPIDRRFNRIERAISAYQGRLLEQQWMQQKIGFDSADAAILAAREMQQRCSVLPQVSANRLALCIGVLCQRLSDPAEESKEIVARLLTLSDGIQATEKVFRRLNSDLRKIAKSEKPAPGEPRIYQFDWRLEIPSTAYVCRQRDAEVAFTKARGTLLLLYQGLKIVSLSEEMPLITIGRDPENDLVLIDDRVSRRHCQILAHRDKVVLIDASTNGTSIVNARGEEYLLKNRRFILHGEGLLRFGREQQISIRFEVC